MVTVISKNNIYLLFGLIKIQTSLLTSKYFVFEINKLSCLKKKKNSVAFCIEILFYRWKIIHTYLNFCFRYV